MSIQQNDKTESSDSALINSIRSVCAPRTEEIQGHAERIVDILGRLGVDQQGQATGYIHGLWPLSDQELGQVESIIGAQAIQLHNDVGRMAQLSDMIASGLDSDAQAVAEHEENLRKMLIIMVDDVRVVVISLAGQLSILRGMKNQSSELRNHHARLARNIYAPLANRLGIGQLKWELEDYAFRYLNPKIYQMLARKLEEKRHVREQYIIDLTDRIVALLEAENIQAHVQGRPKHIYSIWRKMQRKGLEFEQLQDIRAIRIMVNSVEDCYSALSVIHETWLHHKHQFSDYINMPKSNGYQSIHTVISAPDDKAVEVQIRTFAMHEESELGFAAHWRYKETARYDSNFDQKVVWLRQLLEWKNEMLAPAADDPAAGAGSTTVEHAVPEQGRDSRQVYVFTPKGKIIVLPDGATPIDFAYAIHTEVGHRTRGARVNEKMVSLNYPLQTGDQVSIQTVKTGGPSRDWLRPDLGYARTGRARNRISHWYKHAEYDQNVSEGRVMLDRELHRLGLGDLSFEKLNQHTHFQKVDDLLAAIGAHDYKISKLLYPFRKVEDNDPQSIPVKAKTVSGERIKDGLTISGVDNLLTHMAQCCNPVPGDDIIGFITAGRGVTIHRRGCHNISGIKDELRARLVEVDWGFQQDSSYTMGLEIVAYHRSGLLHDITEILKSNRADVLKVNMETDSEQVTRLSVRLQIAGGVHPGKLIRRLAEIQNVFDIHRIGY